MKADRLSRKKQPRMFCRSLENACISNTPNRFDCLPADNCYAIEQLLADEILRYGNLDACPHGFTNDADVLGWAAAMMCESPSAYILLDDARASGWSLKLADLGTGGFHLDGPAKTLQIDNFSLDATALGKSAHFRHALIITLIRGLREIWHENRCGSLEQVFKPEAALLLERMRSADADTIAILAGWELRGAGHSEVWRHILGSEEGDMAIVFTRHLEHDPKALFNGHVLTNTFFQWYADEGRVNSTDHETLEYLDSILLGSDVKAGERSLNAEIVEQIARLPQGGSYLANYAVQVMADPFFVALNDPINQSHLFHIVYDLQVVMAGNVPFRDSRLARRVFPDQDMQTVKR